MVSSAMRSTGRRTTTGGCSTGLGISGISLVIAAMASTAAVWARLVCAASCRPPAAPPRRRE